ncbi:50S ribosomal protein L32 [Candidatus Dojkabacteria bacterium]|nr:50S ribosomal protein L32 [Candidatus Dojkabacteria bacterium]
MGAHPKRKLHRKYTRRSHLSLKWPSFTKDPDTGKLILSHRVSPYTGKYNGKQIVAVKDEA